MVFFIAQDLGGCNVTSKATWKSHASPRGRLCGADVAEPHESTRTPGWCHVARSSSGLASDGPTGIVGPGKIVGAVMQMR